MRPPRHVLAALGLEAELRPLAGGRGTSWRCGDVVLKPVDTSLEELEWQRRLFDSIDRVGFRAPRLLGVTDGWSAWERVEGEHRERAWPEVIAAGGSLHAALRHVPRPSFLDRRSDKWAVGDRVAWEEVPAERFAHVEHVLRLAAARRPVDTSAAQLVHGDLTGNVLFANGLPPAVIDFSPYWRPPAFAAAVVVGDALAWEGADEMLLTAVEHVDDFPQHLVRALLYRIVVDALFRPGEQPRPDGDDCFLVPVELACALAE